MAKCYLLLVFATLALGFSKGANYREDRRCGDGFPGPNGEDAICSCVSQYPCCSNLSWCGDTDDHCLCANCVDYRNISCPTRPTSPPTLQPECYRMADGADYRGSINTTTTGKTCQQWRSQTPNVHSITQENYPDTGLGDHNFCRNSDGEVSAWCYTTDPNTRWEFCNIGSPGEHCEATMIPRTTEATMIPMTTEATMMIPTTALNVEEIDEQERNDQGVTSTSSGDQNGDTDMIDMPPTSKPMTDENLSTSSNCGENCGMGGNNTQPQGNDRVAGDDDGNGEPGGGNAGGGDNDTTAENATDTGNQTQSASSQTEPDDSTAFPYKLVVPVSVALFFLIILIIIIVIQKTKQPVTVAPEQ